MRELEAVLPQPVGAGVGLRISLAALSDRFHRGDERSLTEIWRDVCPPICRRLKRRYDTLLPAADAEQIMLDALQRGWEHHTEFDPERSLEPWLYAIAYRLAADFVRARRRRREAAMSPERLAELPDRTARDLAIDYKPAAGLSARRERLHEMVERGLGELPPQEREVLFAYASSPNGSADSLVLAAELGVSAATVRQRYCRGKAHLKAELQRLGIEDLLLLSHPDVFTNGEEEGRKTENRERS